MADELKTPERHREAALDCIPAIQEAAKQNRDDLVGGLSVAAAIYDSAATIAHSIDNLTAAVEAQTKILEQGLVDGMYGDGVPGAINRGVQQ